VGARTLINFMGGGKEKKIPRIEERREKGAIIRSFCPRQAPSKPVKRTQPISARGEGAKRSEIRFGEKKKRERARDTDPDRRLTEGHPAKEGSRAEVFRGEGRTAF